MNPDQTVAVYDVLVAHAGASEAGRLEFVRLMSHGAVAYRFGGAFGLSGTFHAGAARWWVDADPRDLQGRPGRRSQISEANEALATLRAALATPPTAADAFLLALKADPVRLPPVQLLVGYGPAEAIDYRRRYEVHFCQRCGKRAQVAYIANAGGFGDRWLDLCAECAGWLRSTASQ